MWTLECDGDLLRNKRLWLRPGKKYLLGRVKEEQAGGRFVIEHKSVSRKHMTIEVFQPEAGDVSKIHAKSRVVIEELGTKFGTRLDGEQIRAETKVLQNDVNAIQLGNFNQIFRVRWNSVVLTYSFSSKEQKNKDPLESTRARLEPTDIKAVLPYIVGKTTHVVASKRNTSKGLQALINGKYIVTDSFVDAVVKATTPLNPEDPESTSPLEEDYDGAWPNALQHLPLPTKEPFPRPAESYSPNDKRLNVFEGYTFVFCDRTQFESLQPPITNGGGKAVMYDIEYGKTTVQELVRFMKDLAGEKGAGEFEDGSEGKGVVLVRFRGKKDTEEWCIELGNEVARALDQRTIEQNEFLEAILSTDASGLRRSLPEEDDGLPSQTREAAGAGRGFNRVQPTSEAPAEATKGVSQATVSRLRRRGPVVSQFKGFDDGFDPSPTTQASRKLDVDLQTQGQQQENVSTQRTESRARKRPTPPSEEDVVEDEEAVMDQILPAAAAMKRRRLEEEQNRKDKGEPVTAKPTPPKPTSRSQKGQAQKPKKPVDVRAVARERREAEDENARLDEEALKASFDEGEISKMRDLALIEEMPVKTRSDRATANQGGTRGPRWDERWNGRKNFKRFRRRGEAGNAQPRRSGTVIVGLEEVQKKSLGTMEDRWLESEKHQKRMENTARAAAPKSQSHSRSLRRQAAQPVEEEDEEMGEESDVGLGSTTRAAAAAATTSQAPSGALGGRRAKRTVSTTSIPQMNPNPTSKRQRTTLFVGESESDEDDEDDSGDDLRFRFSKGR
ncbi:MAG: hypothetical protein M1816_000384 [Peltula sp. TS41687]|nr:MAG: hypothetical protein M1816_000384 [Peltula sp. TS41687]